MEITKDILLSLRNEIIDFSKAVYGIKASTISIDEYGEFEVGYDRNNGYDYESSCVYVSLEQLKGGAEKAIADINVKAKEARIAREKAVEERKILADEVSKNQRRLQYEALKKEFE